MSKKCSKKNCVNSRVPGRSLCKLHGKERRLKLERTTDGFLGKTYTEMSKRVRGVCGPVHKRHLWMGKAIMPREVFVEWAKNHPDFLKLFRRWKVSGHKRPLVPSVNRIDSTKGYTLDNVEWLTCSHNSSMANAVRHNNHAAVKEIYRLAGM